MAVALRAQEGKIYHGDSEGTEAPTIGQARRLWRMGILKGNKEVTARPRDLAKAAAALGLQPVAAPEAVAIEVLPDRVLFFRPRQAVEGTELGAFLAEGRELIRSLGGIG